MTNPKNPQIRAYLRSFNYTDDGMAEVEDVRGAVETGDYVRTSDYLLVRNALESEIERLHAVEPPEKPVAYLKEWTMNGKPCCRVDLRRESEQWLEEIATVTPLYASVNRPADPK